MTVSVPIPLVAAVVKVSPNAPQSHPAKEKEFKVIEPSGKIIYIEVKLVPSKARGPIFDIVLGIVIDEIPPLSANADAPIVVKILLVVTVERELP